MSLDILGAVTGLFVIVYDGQHALRFTLGRARAVVGTGLHFKVPLLQKFSVKETKHTTLDLEPQVIQLKDNLVYEIDCKVVYQIVNLRKALIEIDDLVTGLQNRVVMAVQKVVSHQDRTSVTDVDRLAADVREELKPIEDQWGVRILQFGFSNISPSPTTLEITQLELLANEKLKLYGLLRADGLSEEAAVALIAGAVVSVGPSEHEGPPQGGARGQGGDPALRAGSRAFEEGESGAGEDREEPRDRSGRRSRELGARAEVSFSLGDVWSWVLELLRRNLDDLAVVAFTALVALVRAMGVTVDEGQTGLKFSFGHATRVLTPGFYPLLPYLQSARVLPTRSRTLDLPAQRVETREALVFYADANLVYKIVDVRKALIEIDDLQKGMLQALGIGVQDVLRRAAREEIARPGALDAALAEVLARRLGRGAVERAGFEHHSGSIHAAHHAARERLRGATRDRGAPRAERPPAMALDRPRGHAHAAGTAHAGAASGSPPPEPHAPPPRGPPR
jgi:regulator of protease activity HflC (stomatin/prohibitin superfamily)